MNRTRFIFVKNSAAGAAKKSGFCVVEAIAPKARRKIGYLEGLGQDSYLAPEGVGWGGGVF